MQLSTKCWSEHILSAYKATKDLKNPLSMTFKETDPVMYQLKNLVLISITGLHWDRSFKYADNMISSSFLGSTTVPEAMGYF